jgi:hypothetical protein
MPGTNTTKHRPYLVGVAFHCLLVALTLEILSTRAINLSSLKALCMLIASHIIDILLISGERMSEYYL